MHKLALMLGAVSRGTPFGLAELPRKSILLALRERDRLGFIFIQIFTTYKHKVFLYQVSQHGWFHEPSYQYTANIFFLEYGFRLQSKERILRVCCLYEESSSGVRGESSLKLPLLRQS